MKLGPSFTWVLVLFIACIIAALIPFEVPTPIYLRLAIIWGIILVFGFFWTIFSLKSLTIHRRARTLRQQVGQIFEERFDVINRSILPKLWLQIHDSSKLTGISGSRVLTWVGKNQVRSYVSYTVLKRRGFFALGPTTVTSGDVFGLFRSQADIENTSRLLVIPYTVDIDKFPAPFGVLPGGRALRRKTTEVTPYSAGVREYSPGDPLRRIHWPSSARNQKLIVKEFEKDPLAEIWLFVDARANVHCEMPVPQQFHQGSESLWWMRENRKFSLPPSTMEYAVSVAASIAKYYIGQNREVGLTASGQVHVVLPAERGERQLGKIFETLALLEPAGEMPLSSLVNAQLAGLAGGSTVILVTPADDPEVVLTTSELLLRNMLPVVIMIDRDSFGGQSQAKALEAQLMAQGIMVYRINFEDNLKQMLEIGSAVR